MGAIRLRFASLTVSETELEAYHAVIDADERRQAARFRKDHHRRRFVTRRALRRLWLAEQVGAAPGELRFETDAHGKPRLPGGPHFSASHSGDMMMLAVADRPVGCDIEALDDTLDWRPIAAQFFAAEECAALAALPRDAGRQAFFDCWARKEAFVKAIGKGLAHPLDAFVVSVTPRAELVTGDTGWTLSAVTMVGHGCAVAAADDGQAVRLSVAAPGSAVLV